MGACVRHNLTIKWNGNDIHVFFLVVLTQLNLRRVIEPLDFKDKILSIEWRIYRTTWHGPLRSESLIGMDEEASYGPRALRRAFSCAAGG
jgi:hypothetical protein